MPGPQQSSKRALDVLLGILLLCAGAEFLARGPVRFAHAASYNDYISPYVQTRAWIYGEDPYSSQSLVALWPPEADHPEFLARELKDGSLVLKRGIPTAYPLPAFVLNAMIAFLPWHIAQPMWLVITLLSFVVTVASVMSVANLLPWSRRSFVFLTLALALAPFHTALAAGSIVSVAVAASAAAVWAAGREREVLAGLLLAAAVSLKPQIGLPFLFYYFFRRRWRIAAVASGLVATLFVVGMARLTINGTPWLQSYLYDNRILFAPGSLGDFTEQNLLRFGLLNFQVAAYPLLQNRERATIAALAIAVFAGIVWFFLLSKHNGKDRDIDLLALSALAVISLLPLYHRFYDATLLIFPLAWSLTAVQGRFRTISKGILVVIVLVFFVPGGAALQRLQEAGHFTAVRTYWWWNAVILPHESWTILLLVLMLLSAMRKTRATGTYF